MTMSRDEEMPDPAAAAMLPNTPLLITESADEFDRICAALSHEIRPNGIIEQMYVADIAQLAWEILRLRRCKALIINLAFRGALEELAVQLLRNPGQSKFQLKDEAEKLAEAWFSKDSAKEKISQLLNYFDLDESAIEAEAIRRSAADIELLDKLLASLESRRDKALRRIAEYRGDLGRQMRNVAERIIEGRALALQDGSSSRPPEAA
jgi:DNA mismatch repair ATPase MutS